LKKEDGNTCLRCQSDHTTRRPKARIQVLLLRANVLGSRAESLEICNEWRQIMAKSKLGPIPDDHFENEPAPPNVSYPGKWPDDVKAEFDADGAP